MKRQFEWPTESMAATRMAVLSQICTLATSYLYYLIGHSLLHAYFLLALQRCLSPSMRIALMFGCLAIYALVPLAGEDAAHIAVIAATLLASAGSSGFKRCVNARATVGHVPTFFTRKHLILLAIVAGIVCARRDFALVPSVAWLVILAVAAWNTPSTPRSMPLTYKTVAANAALLLFSAALSLAGAEYAARWLFGQPYASQNVLHPRRIFSPRPSGVVCYPRAIDEHQSVTCCYKVSSQGLRDKVYGPKQPGEYRILMLGDSFTVGVGLKYKETIPRVLERLLPSTIAGKRVEVINAGVRSYGPWQELDLFREIAPVIEPDLVILQVLLLNDIADTLLQVDKYPQAHYFQQTRDFLNFKYTQNAILRWHQWLCGESMLYRQLWNSKNADFDIVRVLSTLRFLRTKSGPQVQESVDRPFWLEVNLREWYPELFEGWDLMKKDVEAIRNEAARMGADFVAYAIPTPSCVVPEWWGWAVPEENRALYEPGKEIRIVEEFFQEAQITYVPLSSAMKEVSGPETFFFPYDGHFSSAGARFTANVLAAYLKTSYFPQESGSSAQRTGTDHKPAGS